MALCLSVTGQNSVETAEQIGRVFAWELSLTYPILFCNEIQVPPKLKVLPSGTLPQPLDYQFSLTKLGTLKVQ